MDGLTILTILGLVIAAGGVYYARFARKQHELDRGLKKADVCRAIEAFLGGVSVIGEARLDLLTPFYRATEPNAVALLFDEDGRAYIAELRAQANRLWSTGALEAGMSGDQKRAQTMKRLHLVGWLGQQLGAELEWRLGCRDVRGGSTRGLDRRTR